MKLLTDTWRGERGFSYILLMFAIVLIGLGMTVAARQWKVMVQRELEADLLAKGIEIQRALALYSATMKAGRVVPGEVYPQSLVELTRGPKPFLRKAYGDPLGHGDWDVVRAPTGGIMGVRSRSKAKPIKESDFPLEVRHFEKRKTHFDWVFQHPNPSMAAFSLTGTGMAGSGGVVPSPSLPESNPAFVPTQGSVPPSPMGGSSASPITPQP